MALELPQVIDSKELELRNQGTNHSKAAAGITHTQHLGESPVATRMQNKRKLEILQSNQNKRHKMDLLLIVYITANKIGGILPTRPMIVLLNSGSSIP